MAVPETAMHKHCDSLATENDVRTSRQSIAVGAEPEFKLA
jgi:hypothetical protein